MSAHDLPLFHSNVGTQFSLVGLFALYHLPAQSESHLQNRIDYLNYSYLQAQCIRKLVYCKVERIDQELSSTGHKP